MSPLTLRRRLLGPRPLASYRPGFAEYTHSRASAAAYRSEFSTRIQVPAGRLRDAHFAVRTDGGQERALLLEDGRTNLLPNPRDFSAATWTRQAGVTVAPNNAAAPDGTLEADRIDWGPAATGAGVFVASVAVAAGAAYTTSVYVRADVAGGTIGLTDPNNSQGTTVHVLTTQWRRIELTETKTTAAAGLWVRKRADSPPNIHLWHGQLELGECASTEIDPATGVRSGEDLWVPVVGGPQPCTLYLRHQELGTASQFQAGLAALGGVSESAGGYWVDVLQAPGGVYRARWHTNFGAEAVVQLPAPGPARGQMVETWVTVSPTGVGLMQSFDGAAPVSASAAPPPGTLFPAAYADPRLVLGARAGGSRGFAAFAAGQVWAGAPAIEFTRAWNGL